MYVPSKTVAVVEITGRGGVANSEFLAIELDQSSFTVANPKLRLALTASPFVTFCRRSAHNLATRGHSLGGSGVQWILSCSPFGKLQATKQRRLRTVSGAFSDSGAHSRLFLVSVFGLYWD